jgi:hypothetical protein
MFITLERAKELIAEGKTLHIAADESLLEQLPIGRWVAGTTPYFITEAGGITCKDRLFVEEIDCSVESKVVVYDKTNIFDLKQDAYPNGLVFLIMPFASDVAVFYSKEAPSSEDLLMTPIVGWIAGFDLATEACAKVYDGETGRSYTDKAVALHICLPDDKMASIGIVNIFSTNESDSTITFPSDALSVKHCWVDGKEVVFADYLAEHKIDTQLPLVADYNSVLINVSIKAISAADQTVDFYAPVFAGTEYRFANPVADYATGFVQSLEELKAVRPLFSCNCILNYLYGKLDGKATAPFAGPVTFGEIAYLLLNQTLVYVEIINR